MALICPQFTLSLEDGREHLRKSLIDEEQGGIANRLIFAELCPRKAYHSHNSSRHIKEQGANYSSENTSKAQTIQHTQNKVTFYFVLSKFILRNSAFLPSFFSLSILFQFVIKLSKTPVFFCLTILSANFFILFSKTLANTL